MSGVTIPPSGLRDIATVRFERDRGRLRTAATAGAQAVDRGDLLGRQLEVEDVDVLSDATRLCGLRKSPTGPLANPSAAFIVAIRWPAGHARRGISPARAEPRVHPNP